MAKVLVVDDDKALVETITDWLTFEGHKVESTGDGKEALETLQYYKFDLVVLDWSLPHMSGIEICRAIRARGSNTPVLMLTGKDTTDDKISGLDAGADDYLTKPFDLKELAARIRTLLRRPAEIATESIKLAGIDLDPRNRKVKRGGKEVQLTNHEYQLLEFLMRNANTAFSPEALLDRVWSSQSDTTRQAVRTHIKTLRKKIDSQENASLIKNIHGVGYLFEAKE